MTKHKKRSKKIKITPIVLIFGVSLLLIIGYRFFVRTPVPQSIGINQVDNATGGVSLSLAPASSSIKPGEETTLTLTANAGDLKITYTKIELSYDTAKIGTPVVTLGSFLTNSFADPIIGNGKIVLEVAAPPSSGGKSGSGTIATIKIKPTIVGNSSVSITSNTTVSAIDTTGTAIAGNSLKSATDAVIIAANTESTPTPTSTPTTKPTPRPTQATYRSTPTPTPTTQIEYIEPTNNPERTFAPSSFGQNDHPLSQPDLDKMYPDPSVKKTFLERIIEFFRNLFGGQ